MSDQMNKEGPVLSGGIEEVQGVFPSDAALEDAIGRLRLAGFDHADLSLPLTRPPAGLETPEMGAENPLTEDDARQTRTLGTSMAATVGAFAAAGVTVATGGAAGVVIAAAAAVGAGSALAANAVESAALNVTAEERAARAARGELVLAVRALTPEQQGTAERLMREAGASEVAAVHREGGAVAGIDSSAWTG